MGYWIIVSLVVLAGVLVLLAAASADPGESNAGTAGSNRRNADSNRSPFPHTSTAREVVHVVLFAPRWWRIREQIALVLDIPGTHVLIEEVEGSTLSALAAAMESKSLLVRDSVAVIVTGADDFLAGETLEGVLDQIEELLDHLTHLPSMAVISSLPDLSMARMSAGAGMSDAAISETITAWNAAIADLAHTYSAEFANLRSVPFSVTGPPPRQPGIGMIAVPDAAALLAALRPAIDRAVERVRSIREHS